MWKIILCYFYISYMKSQETTVKSWNCHGCRVEWISVQSSYGLKTKQLTMWNCFSMQNFFSSRQVILSISRDTSTGHNDEQLCETSLQLVADCALGYMTAQGDIKHWCLNSNTQKVGAIILKFSIYVKHSTKHLRANTYSI